ncbi:MAG: hypothetical protein ACR2NQ_03415 [Thermodesulfobacteriota bacterium]
MLKNFIRYTVFAVLAVALGAPSAQAVEIELDAFPSFLRTRARYFKGATYINDNLPHEDTKDRIFLIDSTLRISPRLRLSDNLSIVVQADVADNVIWGGVTDQLLGGASTVVNSSISPTDSFRGVVLTPTYRRFAYLDERSDGDNVSEVNGSEDTGNPIFERHAAVEPDGGWLKVRQAYIHATSRFGFARVGRQTFDWGLGIFSNGGNDPSSIGGTITDRILVGKTARFDSGATFTAALFSDLWAGGKALRPVGAGWDGFGATVVYNRPPENIKSAEVTLGANIYPWVKQENFVRGRSYFLGAGESDTKPSANADLNRLTIYSLMFDLKRGDFRFAGEYNAAFGKLDNLNGYKDGTTKSERDYIYDLDDGVKIQHHMAWALRLEWLPLSVIQVAGAEFGWADGDKTGGGGHAYEGGYWNGDDIEGGVIAFNPAYTIDNFLFKHIIPTIYQSTNNKLFTHAEAGIQNSSYLRFYVNVFLTDSIRMTAQWLAGWTNETKNLFVDGEDIASYIGSEVETTFTFRLRRGVYFNVIGSAVFAGLGLRDMFEGQAWNEIVRSSNDDIYFAVEEQGIADPIYDDPQTPEYEGSAELRDIKVWFVNQGEIGDDGRSIPWLEATVNNVIVSSTLDDDKNSLPQIQPDRPIAPSEAEGGTNCPDVLGVTVPDGCLDPARFAYFKDLEKQGGLYAGEAHLQAYRELREQFANNYPESAKAYSLQTVLTVHLDGLSGN